MPVKIKIKTLVIIVLYLVGGALISHLISIPAGIVYIAMGVYFLYKIYPKFDLSPDIKFNKDKKIVSLTFDDGPTKGFTEEILKVLKNKNVTASFFVLGSKIQSNVELIKKIIEQGCEIGTHTISHKKLHNASAPEIAAELEPAIDSIRDIYSELGKSQEFKKIFRPPHGFKNLALKRYLRSNSIKLIPWTRGVWDTDVLGSKWIIEKAIVKPMMNEIILLHDGLGLEGGSKKQKADLLEALPKIIDFYKDNEYTFVKASSFLKE